MKKTAYYLDWTYGKYLMIDTQNLDEPMFFLDEKDLEIIRKNHEGKSDEEIFRYIMKNMNEFNFEKTARVLCEGLADMNKLLLKVEEQ